MGEGAKKVVLAAVLAALAVSVGAGAGLIGRPAPGSTTATSSDSSTAPERIEVHVAGWVVSSGVVSVREGSIVADVIEAAGGLRPGATTEAINLAAEVFPGDQIVVPGPSPEGEAGNSQSTGTDGGLISLNRAGVTELEELPGVGPVLAERIVTFREENGRFESVEELLEVPGIGEAKLASIRDLVHP